MLTDTLPPLPLPTAITPEASRHFVKNVLAYTPDQMREYAQAAVTQARAAEREACAKLCDGPGLNPDKWHDVGTLRYVAAAIRARKDGQ